MPVGTMNVWVKATAQDLTPLQPFPSSEWEREAWDRWSLCHLPGPVSPRELGRLSSPTQASPDKARSSLRPALSMMRAATAVKRTWMMPTVTEARLLSWERGEAGLLERDKSPPPSLAVAGSKGPRLQEADSHIWPGAGWAEVSYLELGLLKDGFGIEHDGIDPRQLLEGHE